MTIRELVRRANWILVITSALLTAAVVQRDVFSPTTLAVVGFVAGMFFLMARHWSHAFIKPGHLKPSLSLRFDVVHAEPNGLKREDYGLESMMTQALKEKLKISGFSFSWIRATDARVSVNVFVKAPDQQGISWVTTTLRAESDSGNSLNHVLPSMEYVDGKDPRGFCDNIASEVAGHLNIRRAEFLPPEFGGRMAHIGMMD